MAKIQDYPVYKDVRLVSVLYWNDFVEWIGWSNTVNAIILNQLQVTTLVKLKWNIILTNVTVENKFGLWMKTVKIFMVEIVLAWDK